MWKGIEKGRQCGPISGEGTRTLDTADMSRMLYHLSYAAARGKEHIIVDRGMSTDPAP